MTKIPYPEERLVRPAYLPYVQAFGVNDAFLLLEEQAQQFMSFLKRVPSEKYDFAYAPEKWTVRRVLQHITDTERIFAYRALCMARGETGALPAFEENEYAAADDSQIKDWELLLKEWELVRKATLAMYEGMSAEAMSRIGSAGNSTMNPVSIAWTIAGHTAHHFQIMKDRYGLL